MTKKESSKTEQIVNSTKILEETFNGLQIEKEKVAKEANEKIEEINKEQANVNTQIVKNQGKLELLNEESKIITPK